MEQTYFHESILILFGLKGLFFSKSLANSMEKNPEILFLVLPSESKAEKVSVDWPNPNPHRHKIVSTDVK